MAPPKKKKAQKKQEHVSVSFNSAVLQYIRQHARSSPEMEICGVLIGQAVGKKTIVTGAIAGKDAAQGGAHVTFTQATWNHIHHVKEKKYPELSIVGWYHSHPGFGVFLSEHDLFIHNNFFSDPGHVAWVFDPKSDEEGCFGWFDKEITRIPQFSITADLDHAAKPEDYYFVKDAPKKPLLAALLHQKFLMPFLVTLSGCLLLMVIILFITLRLHTTRGHVSSLIQKRSDSVINDHIVYPQIVEKEFKVEKPDSLDCDGIQ